MPPLRSITLLVLMAAPALAAAQVFSWKDENGKVHYGSQPPASKRGEARKLAAPPPSDAVATEKAPPDKSADGTKSQKGQETIQKLPEDPAAARQREEGCRQAKANLAALESGQIRFKIDDKGERIGLDGELRDAEIAKARKNVTSWCSPPASAPAPAAK